MPGFDAEPAALVQADSGYLILKTPLIMTQAKMPHFFKLFGCRQNVFYYKLYMLHEGIITHHKSHKDTQ